MWMYWGNLSLRTFFNIFFFIRRFSNFLICSNLVGFNRINSTVILLNVQNQLMTKFLADKIHRILGKFANFTCRKFCPTKIVQAQFMLLKT